MPVHDWSRVGVGIFHDFHCAWIVEIRNTLNEGLLPPNYYAMAEQIVGDLSPDVLTLQAVGPAGDVAVGDAQPLMTAAPAPPKVRSTATTTIDVYAQKQRTLVIRHSSEDRIVALIEILSPGNKSSRHALRAFVDKAAAALVRGYHLLLVDLQPPGPRDPQGIHGALWEEIGDDSYEAPPDKPLTLAAYSAGPVKTAYVEPIAVGDVLPDMPLFLGPETYVSLPLEATYQAAWRGVPRRWHSDLGRRPRDAGPRNSPESASIRVPLLRILTRPFDLGRLAEAFLDFDPEHPREGQSPRRQPLAKPAGDVVGQQFRGRIGDRQEGAFVAREAPVPVAVADPPVRSLLVEMDQGTAGRQEHPMIDLVDDAAGQVLQRDEIEDVVILVEVVFHLDGRPVVVAVDPLALVSGVGDEVPRAED